MGFESRDEVIGRSSLDFAAPGSREQYLDHDWPALLAGREVKESEYRVIKNNGEAADVLVSSRPWHDSEGRFVRTMTAIIDVTGRKRTEEALRQAQKVEAMGQLTGGVAHDFNNLLSPIIGGLDLMQRRGIGDPRAQQTVASALQAAERAKTLVQRLLAFARRQPLQPAPVDAGRLIEGLADLIGSTVGPRIRVELDVAEDLPPCLADPNQVELALLNLAVNARDAMPDGGTLTIAASVEQVGEGAADLAPGSYVRLSVSDTGCGMEEEVAARAIEPFFSTKGIGRGTGLGLSMVHGLAAQLGGALRLHSAPGAGTDIQLWLPCAAAAAEAGGEAQAPRAIATAGTALLVDDEPLVRASTAEMLEDLGFSVIALESADEAAAHLAGGLAVDLVVTDHLMPGMTGAELARTVRASGAAIPVLIISGYADAGGIDADLPRLNKPFRHADLAAVLTNLLG
jgi:PAS domain S-box-containing protein